jgi:hypothetical protein
MIRPLAGRVADVLGFLIELLAKFLAAALRRILSARYEVADPCGWFAGQAFDPDAVGGVVGDFYVLVI